MSSEAHVSLSDFAAQGTVYESLMHSLQTQTLPHACILTGAAGLGKRTLADLITAYLLCTGETKPCGQCPDCIQVGEGTHPDVTTLRPGLPISSETAAGKKQIPVDDVREAVRRAGEHAFRGRCRVIRIEHAEQMTVQAQNALLKTLEEPPEETCFLLETEAAGMMLPTIVSRCRELRLHPWPDAVLRDVLRKRGVPETRISQVLHVSGGSIGKALSRAGDEAFWTRRREVLDDFFAITERSAILAVSTKWKDRKDDSDQLLDDLEDMIHSLLAVRLGRANPDLCREFPEAWQRMAHEGNLQSFVNLLDRTAEAREMRRSQVTWQAVVEKLLFGLMEEKIRWHT